MPVLVEASEESDLLVLGGRGLGRLMTLIVGSKSLALAARAHCPVVVVRGRIDGRGPIGLVHHEIATEVVVRAADLAEAYGRDIHLVVRPETTPEEAQEILAGIAQRIAVTHPSVFVRDVTIAASDSPKELIQASEDASLMMVAGSNPRRRRQGRRPAAAGQRAALRQHPGLDRTGLTGLRVRRELRSPRDAAAR